jgi:hypothetical protein
MRLHHNIYVGVLKFCAREGKIMDGFHYNGYVIEAVPYQLADDKKWTININIWKEKGSSITQRNFSVSNTFVDKEEAVQHCYNLGKQIIDGELKGMTVADF